MNENEIMNEMAEETVITDVDEYVDDLSEVVEQTDGNQIFVVVGLAAAALIGVGIACRGKIKEKINQARINALIKRGYVVYLPGETKDSKETDSNDSEKNPEE